MHKKMEESEGMTFVCDECGNVFKTKLSLKNHVRSQHKVNIKLYTQVVDNKCFMNLFFLYIISRYVPKKRFIKTLSTTWV